MGIRFKCHHCQAPLNIKTELANKRGVCPQCQGKFRIPSESQEHSLSLDQSGSTLSNPRPIAESDLARSGAKKLERKHESVVGLPSQATETDASSDTPNSDSHAGELLYFVRPPSGGEYGPANKMTIELWIAQRRITGETLICQIGSSQWKKAKEVFAAHFILG